MIVGPRVLVSLQQATESKSSSGYVTYTWATICSFRAVVVTMSGSETAKWEKMGVFATHNLFMDKRFDVTITEKDRIVHGSATYEVAYVENYFGRGTKRWKLFLKETR